MTENEQKFELVLDPIANEIANKTEEEAVAVVDYGESRLTEEERALVNDFSQKIDINNSAQIMMYGSPAQEKMSSFSDTALENVKSKDLGQVGEMMTDLNAQLKDFEDDTDKKGLARLFSKPAKKIEVLKARYDKAEDNVETICNSLEGHQVTLMKDVAVLDKLYDQNLSNFKELSLYIIAGKKKLEYERTVTLEELRKKAIESNLPEDAQKANDFSEVCLRFEKRIHDLELTRVVAVQMAPQIRLVQNNDTLMAEKIQSVIVNTIPLWKSQMVLALGLEHSRQAMEAERAVTDMTNELLKKNADALKMSTVEVAKESERGIVDLETLKYTNEQLISTLDEVLNIQAEGSAKRAEAEAELGRLETELKNKLLEIKK